MKGSEFLRKIKELGRENGIKVELIESRGKGSHSTLLYGDRFTILRNLKDELKTGTYNAMQCWSNLVLTKKNWGEIWAINLVIP